MKQRAACGHGHGYTRSERQMQRAQSERVDLPRAGSHTDFLGRPYLRVLIVQGDMLDALSHSVVTELGEGSISKFLEIKTVAFLHFCPCQNFRDLIRKERSSEILDSLCIGSIYAGSRFCLSNGKETGWHVAQDNA